MVSKFMFENWWWNALLACTECNITTLFYKKKQQLKTPFLKTQGTHSELFFHFGLQIDLTSEQLYNLQWFMTKA